MMIKLFKNPIAWVIIAIILVVLVGYASYTMKTQKLAELEYREEVRQAQQELVNKYKEAEKQIDTRHTVWEETKKEITKNVDKEVNRGKDSKGSYTIVASDSNDSVQ